MQAATQKTAMTALLSILRDRRETRQSEGAKCLDTEEEHRERINSIGYVIETGEVCMHLIDKYRRAK